MTKKTISRRQFLKMATGTSIAAVGFGFPQSGVPPYFVPSSALGKAGSVAPSNRIVMGCIGVGGQGTRNMLTFLNEADVQIVALCDVNKGSDDYDMLYQFPDSTSAGLEPAIERAERAYAEKKPSGTCKGIDGYRDFRELLARDDIDAVSVCTPDHWHALVSIAAAKAGMDIYCEKPLANTVAESKAMRDAVKRYGRVLQTGSHERSRDSVRFACELVRNGRIGKLHTIRINMPFDEPQHLEVIKNAHPHPEMPIPEGFDYDMWLGHTPYVPYTKKRCHFWWRFILSYGGGEMTDRGAHIIDIGQLGNNTDDTGPFEIAAKGKRLPKGLYDTFMEYEFEFKYANGVRMVGGSQTPKEAFGGPGKSEGTRGLKFEGTDGWIFIHIHGGRLEAEPQSLLKEVIGPDEIHLGRSPGHHRNFLDAVKSRGEPVAPVEVGHRTATICHLTNIAMLTEQELRWNPETERITNSYEAECLLTPVMRSPWYL